MVEKLKQVADKLTVIPKQKSTFGGIAVIVQQLIQVLSDVSVGGWIASLTAQGVTYGSLLSSYWPIAAGILLVFFDETKLKSLIGK